MKPILFSTNSAIRMNKTIPVILFLTIFLTSGLSLFAQKSTAYQVVADKSELEWIGHKLTGEHRGNILVQSGNLTFNGNDLTGGTVVVNMQSITVTDIAADNPQNKKLVKHLENKDFFDVAGFPTATLSIQSVKKKKKDVYDVTANLTIKGIVKPIRFDAVVTGRTRNTIVSRAELKIDRTQYGIVYKSSALGEATIHDVFDLNIKLVAIKKK